MSKGREGKGREGKGREGKGREGKGREGNALWHLSKKSPKLKHCNMTNNTCMQCYIVSEHVSPLVANSAQVRGSAQTAKSACLRDAILLVQNLQQPQQGEDDILCHRRLPACIQLRLGHLF